MRVGGTGEEDRSCAGRAQAGGVRKCIAGAGAVDLPVEAKSRIDEGGAADSEDLPAAICRLERAVRRLHTYEVPEIIAVPIAGGSREYLKWISESVRPASR